MKTSDLLVTAAIGVLCAIVAFGTYLENERAATAADADSSIAALKNALTEQQMEEDQCDPLLRVSLERWACISKDHHQLLQLAEDRKTLVAISNGAFNFLALTEDGGLCVMGPGDPVLWCNHNGPAFLGLGRLVQ